MRSLRLTGTLEVRGSEKLQRTYVRGQGLPARTPVRPKGFLGSVLVRRRGPGQRRWLSGEPPLGITSAYITNADRANADGANDDAIVHQLGWQW